ncbi:MAG: OmpH family outer membrane protein [Acidobacteria bacterium]|nr:OmpH family outer membrane protein [Acidobacteriota bacterium]
MKRLSVVVIALVALFSSTAIMAQTRVGVVDADQVIYKSAKGKAFMLSLNNYVQQKQNEIKQVVAEAQQTEKEYKTKLASLSDEKKLAMEKKLSDYQTRIKRMQEDAKRELQIKQKQGFEKFQKLLQPVIDKLAKEKNLDIVFSRSQSGIVYLSPTADLTAEAIKRVDAKH